VEPGVTTTPIWTDDYYDAVDETQGADSEEEDENEAGMPPDFDPVIEIGADVDETFPALGVRLGNKSVAAFCYMGWMRSDGMFPSTLSKSNGEFTYPSRASLT
jgi:hypothetical protein